MLSDRKELRGVVLKRRIMAGQDVEFLLRNKDGKYISAVGIVPGYKDEPSRQHAVGSNRTT